MEELFEHKADVGVRGKGKTLEEAFEGCAKAMFKVMADVKAVQPLKSAKLSARADDLGALLVNYLNELLYLKDTKKMLYSQFRVKIKELEESREKKFLLEGVVFGEKIDPKKHGFRVDAKAATYSQLTVEKHGEEWIAQCVVDV